MSLIHLTISRNYVSTWGIWEAVREIVQNAYDTKTHKINYDFNKMTVNTNSGILDRRNLLLGISSKRDDNDSIGTYGEGFKLALLVLLREGRQVVIKNGNDRWTPVFSYHEQLQDECLAIQIDENVYEDHDGQVTYEIFDLSDEEILDIQEKTLYQFDKNKVEAYHDKSFCWYKDDNSGKLYVGGLYVCDLDPGYLLSYNFAPNILELDRDRKSVSSFYLSLEGTKMIVLSGNTELISDLADAGSDDVSDFYNVDHSYHSGVTTTIKNDLKSVVTKNFVSKYGLNAYPINANSNEKEKRVQTIKAMDAGLIPVVIRAGYYNMLESSITEQRISSYKSFNVSDEIVKFFEDNKSQLRGKPRRALEQLIEKIELYEGKRELPKEVVEKVVIDKELDDIPF